MHPVRDLRLLIALALTGFGIGCLNYTVDGKAELHRVWAQERGLPEPGKGIFVLGMTCTVAGAGLAGFVLGRRRSAG